MTGKVFMQHGNDCFSACVATILNMKSEQVPRYFKDDGEPCTSLSWHEFWASWLNPKGYQIIGVDFSEEFATQLKGMFICAGLSYTEEFRKKGIHHAVVYRDGLLWHDPKPNPTGVITPTEIDLIIPIHGGYSNDN